MQTLAIFGLGVPELLIILAVVLLLFGGSRLAGLGKSTGRALKEFKEETKGLKAGEEEQPSAQEPPPQAVQPPAVQPSPPPASRPADWPQPPSGNVSDAPSSDARKDA